MPVSGLVVSLCFNPQSQVKAIELMGEEPRITLGKVVGNRLPIVVDTTSDEDDRELWDWLNSLPGVDRIEVAFVGFEQDDGAEAIH